MQGYTSQRFRTRIRVLFSRKDANPGPLFRSEVSFRTLSIVALFFLKYIKTFVAEFFPGFFLLVGRGWPLVLPPCMRPGGGTWLGVSPGAHQGGVGGEGIAHPPLPFGVPGGGAKGAQGRGGPVARGAGRACRGAASGQGGTSPRCGWPGRAGVRPQDA